MKSNILGLENESLVMNSRRNIFQDVLQIGFILEENGFVSIYLIQHRMRIGFTYAAKIIDFLVDVGELYKGENGRYYSNRISKL
jgi:hypothetical protein